MSDKLKEAATGAAGVLLLMVWVFVQLLILGAVATAALWVFRSVF